MCNELWEIVRKHKDKIDNTLAHTNDDRGGRYSRALEEVGRILANGIPIGFKPFERNRKVNQNVCYLTCWKKESYEEFGKYIVFKIFFSAHNKKRNDQIGYRKFSHAQICTYYDGLDLEPVKPLKTKQEALACMKMKGDYREYK